MKSVATAAVGIDDSPHGEEMVASGAYLMEAMEDCLVQLERRFADWKLIGICSASVVVADKLYLQVGMIGDGHERRSGAITESW